VGGVIALGSDVLAIHHLSLRSDPRWRENEEALARLRGTPKALSIYALLDLVGLVSRHVSERSSRDLYLGYLRSEEHTILFPPHHDSWEEHIDTVMRFLARGMNYRDALEAMALEATPEVELYLSWKTSLSGRVAVKTQTPSEYLAGLKG
jgi:hypothetical protein